MSSEQRFGYEWSKYGAMAGDYERLFRNWTHPLTPSDWNGKKVLDAGCGMGRNSYWAMKYGAASITAFDYDLRSVARAKETLKEFPAAEVVFQSIDDIEWENKFDIAFSIGVIHHLKDPRRALANLVRALKTGGTLLLWVYGYEGNEWIVRFVNPIRMHITSKLPVALVHVLAYACSVPLYLFVKVFRGPSRYLAQLADFGFWHIHLIVFDQLIPDVANYWKKKEVCALIKGFPLEGVTVEPPPNNSGWILIGKKSEDSASS